MARSKTSTEKPFRKLSKVGSGRSYSLTIPKKYVQELGWQEHQKLVIERRGEELVIRDWE